MKILDDKNLDLRDYFAIRALPSVIDHWPSADFIGAAEIAYQYADAMMDARQEPYYPENYEAEFVRIARLKDEAGEE